MALSFHPSSTMIVQYRRQGSPRSADGTTRAMLDNASTDGCQSRTLRTPAHVDYSPLIVCRHHVVRRGTTRFVRPPRRDYGNSWHVWLMITILVVVMDGIRRAIVRPSPLTGIHPPLIVRSSPLVVWAQFDEETQLTRSESLRQALYVDLSSAMMVPNDPEPPHVVLCDRTQESHDEGDERRGEGEEDENDESRRTALRVLHHLIAEGGLADRLTHLFRQTHTAACQTLIAEHLGYFLAALGREEALPYSDVQFPNDCQEPVYDWDNLPPGVHIGLIQNRTYQPPRNESVYLEEPNDLRLCYGILTHDDPTATIRLIETLHEDGHSFVIHVDGKKSSDDTFDALSAYAADKDYVHIVPTPNRVRINWGGFSMVNATLQILRFAFAVDTNDATSTSTLYVSPPRSPIDFHKFVHLASTSYPLASNAQIRYKLASYPLDANFMHVIMKPTRPQNHGWHYFVECDDRLHRIYRLPPLQNATANAELFTSSQWFIISREFAEYLAVASPGSFVHQFIDYASHVVVADEHFFGTVLRHTEFCTKHHNQNFLHLQFDRWESDLPAEHRDERKCMMPDPNHCGRSPTTMTIDYADILELSDDLFARKFVGSKDSFVKDVVDQWRIKREQIMQHWNQSNSTGPPTTHERLRFEGHGVLIVAKDTAMDDVPLCLGIGDTGNKLKLVPCFKSWVRPTLVDEWETGAVILEETRLHNRWDVGPCTSDGVLRRSPSAHIVVTPGNYSINGPRCMLQQMDGVRAGRCFDCDSTELQPGGETQVYPCVKRWYQFLSFGDGKVAPQGSLYTTIPSHIVRQIHNLGHTQNQHMCLGVYGRGDSDEIAWHEQDEAETNRLEPKEAVGDQLKPLSKWEGDQIITTDCNNVGAVVEWLFVPYILDDVNPDDNQSNATSPSTNIFEDFPLPMHGEIDSSIMLNEQPLDSNNAGEATDEMVRDVFCKDSDSDQCRGELLPPIIES